MDFKILLYFIFGILPSVMWLSYYLKKDLHPEPKRMIIKIFFYGALITIPTLVLELIFSNILNSLKINIFFYNLIYWFLIIALLEEFFKFLVVRAKVLNSPHLDEPIDFVIYMITSALGFAAVENICFLFSPLNDYLPIQDVIGRTVLITFIRFIGGTFLHTLCSSLIGYAWAISLYDEKNRISEFLSGITTAILLHGAYNFSIMTLKGYLKIILPILILLLLALFVFRGIEKIKKIKSITILNYDAKNKT